jgi:hypothetical protein
MENGTLGTEIGRVWAWNVGLWSVFLVLVEVRRSLDEKIPPHRHIHRRYQKEKFVERSLCQK